MSYQNCRISQWLHNTVTDTVTVASSFTKLLMEVYCEAVLLESVMASSPWAAPECVNAGLRFRRGTAKRLGPRLCSAHIEEGGAALSSGLHCVSTRSSARRQHRGQPPTCALCWWGPPNHWFPEAEGQLVRSRRNHVNGANSQLCCQALSRRLRILPVPTWLLFPHRGQRLSFYLSGAEQQERGLPSCTCFGQQLPSLQKG